MDDKLLFVLPFLIPFIISNNLFAADPITLVAIILMIVSYYIFNIKGHCGSVRLMPVIFMGFSLLGYMSFFIQDHDITT